jgi:hypothetical protein
MNPTLIASLLGAIPGLASLFGGGPQVPSYSAQDYTKLFSQLYAQMLGSPSGQGQLNQANLAGSQFNNQLNANLGATGMNTTGVGAIQGAGGAGYTSLARNNVLSGIANNAGNTAMNLLGGQQRSGEFNWQNPSGGRAFAGNIGASSWPLILKMMQGQSGGGSGGQTNFGGSQPWWATGQPPGGPGTNW